MNQEREEREYSDNENSSTPKSATRPADLSDQKPPMISPARGPMDQATPDVPTGSTPLTRRDD